jgi:tetratricopeptide (TPR) repeat protein
MTVSTVPARRASLAIIAALMTASIAIQVVRDRGWQPYQPPSGVMWVRSGEFAKRLALGFDNVAADVYWMRAVVYFGGHRLAEQARSFDQLFPLLDLVTSLDPYFTVAYRFGAIFLAEPLPGGAGRPDLAIQLLEKGVAADPRRWEYLEDIGFVHYFSTGNYALAAEAFKRAAAVPGAPEWLGPLAATTLAEGGNRESSRLLWTQLRDTTDIEWIRTSAAHRLQQLDAMDTLDALNAASRRFIEKHRRPPQDLRELAVDQRWRGIPVDPTGAEFMLDFQSGEVRLGDMSTLYPLPVGPSTVPRQ